MKRTWNILKGIINKKKQSKIQTRFKIDMNHIITDKSQISENFNDFLVNIGPNLASKIPVQNTSPEAYLGQKIQNSILLSPVELKEFDEIISSLKKCAPGYDEFNKDSLMLSFPYVKNLLIHLLNISLSQGIFPDELKIANVLPLFKADDSMKFNNYRPVSLLSIFSKIYEKAMYNRLMDFLETHKILYEKQFGFRKHHSSYMAHMILVDNLIKAIENGDYIIGVFLDFSKAFDTVDHSILLSKLFHYGIRGIAYKWFESYLQNRKQCVTYNDTKSSFKRIKCGVPQGSILGPILFLIYINDLVATCKKTLPFLFADDTNLFIKGKNLIQLTEMINNELCNISKWLKVNKLSLNIKKTHFMIFTSKKAKPDSVSVNIDGHEIDEVKCTKFLGVYIDNKLTWKKHIEYICGKVSRGIGIILRARHLLNHSALKTLYYSFVYPYFSYCNHVWGNTCSTYLNRLYMLQKRVIRVIAFAKYRDHTGPLFEKFGLLKLCDINKYAYSKFMYKWYHAMLPLIFEKSFTGIQDVHTHDTRISRHLYKPKMDTNLGQTSFCFRGSQIWNSILKARINPDVSDLVFSKYIKQCLKVGLI